MDLQTEFLNGNNCQCIFKSNTIPIKRVVFLFVYFRIWQVISELHMKRKEPKIAETILKKKNKIAGLLLSNFKNWLHTYSKEDRFLLA